MEREREIGVLRAIGASRRQVLGIFLGEAALIGLTASIVGLLSGSLLAVILTWVVNKAFFGWTIAFSYPLACPGADALVDHSRCAAGRPFSGLARRACGAAVAVRFE